MNITGLKRINFSLLIKINPIFQVITKIQKVTLYFVPEIIIKVWIIQLIILNNLKFKRIVVVTVYQEREIKERLVKIFNYKIIVTED